MDLNQAVMNYANKNGVENTKMSELMIILNKVQGMNEIVNTLRHKYEDLTPDEIGDKIEAGEINLDEVAQEINSRTNEENNKEDAERE